MGRSCCGPGRFSNPHRIICKQAGGYRLEYINSNVKLPPTADRFKFKLGFSFPQRPLQRLLELAKKPTPKSVHFVLQCPKVSLRCQAFQTEKPTVVSPAPDIPHTPGGPDVSLIDRILLIGFPFLPDDIQLEVDQVILDHIGDVFNHIPQQGNNDEREVPFNVVMLPEEENNRIGSVAWARILVLVLSLLSTFSSEDLIEILRPHLIRFFRYAACVVWWRWGLWIAYSAASSYAPRLSLVVIRLIFCLPASCIALLPPDYIALLPPLTIERLPPSCIERLPSSCIETLSPSCIETLSPSCIQTLSPSCIVRLSPSCIARLTLDFGTQMEVQFILLQHMVDRLSLRVADLVPWVPVRVVIIAMRFCISCGFWSLSLSSLMVLYRLFFP